MRMKISILINMAALLAGFNSFGALSPQSNWPQFRGPGARGVATSTNLPDHWSATENVAWQVGIPGSGWSSPIVWGDRVFLTTAISSGDSEPPKKGLYIGGERRDAPRPRHEWKVLCLDLPSGKVRWEKAVHQGEPPGPKHDKNNYDSDTPVDDAARCVG